MVEQFRQEPEEKKITMTTLGSKRYGFFLKMPDGNIEKPNCAMLKFRMKIELAEKLRKQKKSQQHKNEAENTHAQQS